MTIAVHVLLHTPVTDKAHLVALLKGIEKTILYRRRTEEICMSLSQYLGAAERKMINGGSRSIRIRRI